MQRPVAMSCSAVTHELNIKGIYDCRFAGLTLSNRGDTLDTPVGEFTSAAGALRTSRAAAELLRVALVRGAPRTARAAALGVMLEDFAVSCERVTRFVGTQDAAGAHDLACFCCARIARAQPGEVVLLPLGWLGAANGNTPPPATVVLMVLCRRRDQPGTFDLAIINGGGAGGAGGDGVAIARYHGLKANAANADLWSRAAVVLSDVPQEKLQDGGIWFVLYRLLIFPHAAPPASHSKIPAEDACTIQHTVIHNVYFTGHARRTCLL